MNIPPPNTTEAVQPCVLIPVYNHEHAIAKVVSSLERHKLECILVDDGSRQTCKQALESIEAQYNWVSLHRIAVNSGKGIAAMFGLEKAQEAGFTHAIMMDADGQHSSDDIPALLSAANKAPNAFILGDPQFDDAIPKSRLYGRYLTHIFVWLNTWSFDIHDALCGYRVYPVSASLLTGRKHPPGARMDFDPEIAVRMHWDGVEMQNVKVKVSYPDDGVSHFRMFKDNVRISAMHSRLILGMLIRLPQILWRKFKH